jgi:hypothetical protein
MNIIYIPILDWRGWLGPYATSRKVACSVPDVVIGFLIDLILPVTSSLA